MDLTKNQFTILNVLADGSEPFSMVCADVWEQDESSSIKAIADDLCLLMKTGHIRAVDIGEASFEELTVRLCDHYDLLQRELRAGKFPFYYSKGEFFFEMTAEGRKEWDSPGHRRFYEHR